MNTKSIYTLLIFIISFIVYALTAAPDVMFTDSGELASVCSTLGTAHPTGYPLFTIIGYLWTLLPLPFSKIYSLNLMASFFTAGSAALFFNILITLNDFNPVRKSSKSKTQTKNKKNIFTEEIALPDNKYVFPTMAAMSFIYAFGVTVWQQATAIEVYSLHLLMICLTLFLFLKGILSQEKNINFLLGASFTLGLSFTNHLTTVLILPAVLYLFFKRPGEKLDFSKARMKQFGILSIPFVIGLSLYLYLPFRADMQPDFNWGYVSRSWDKFLYHVMGKQYQVWMFSGTEAWKENFGKFFAGLPGLLVFAVIIPFFYAVLKIIKGENKSLWATLLMVSPIAVPLYLVYKKSTSMFYFLILLIFTCIAYSFNYSIHDIESYFLTAYIAIIIFTALNAIELVKEFEKYAPIILLSPFLSLANNFHECNLSNDYAVKEYTYTLMNNLEPNAVIISSQWDYWCSAFWYYNKIENVRPDISLIEKELLRRTWYTYTLDKWYPDIMNKCKIEEELYMRDLELFESNGNYNPQSIQMNYIALLNKIIDSNFDKRPIYITLDILVNEPQIGEKYTKVPQGFAFRLYKDNMPKNIDLSKIKLDKFAKSIKGKNSHLYEGIRETAVINIQNIGKYAAMTGNKTKADEAAQLFKSIKK